MKVTAFQAANCRSPCFRLHARKCSVHCSATTAPASQTPLNRRTVLGAVSAALPAIVGLERPAFAAKTGVDAEVGAYLPPAGVEDLVLFEPDMKKTPPNCGEPWTEVVFESPSQGKLQVMAFALLKFTNKPNTPIQDIGTPESILQRVGPFITGTYLDDEEVVSATSKTQDDGRMYYYYEVNASYGTNGPHALAACTTKADNAYLFIVSANDKQWAKTEGKLRKVVETFRA